MLETYNSEGPRMKRTERAVAVWGTNFAICSQLVTSPNSFTADSKQGEET